MYFAILSIWVKTEVWGGFLWLCQALYAFPSICGTYGSLGVPTLPTAPNAKAAQAADHFAPWAPEAAKSLVALVWRPGAAVVLGYFGMVGFVNFG